MNEPLDDQDDDFSAPASSRSTFTIVGGIVLMPIGVAMMVGGIILHFAEKAERFVLFPYAGRLIILAGIGVIGGSIAMAGSRIAVWFGSATLIAGLCMLIFGYLNLGEPSLRFYAPLGFFLALAGLALIWGAREFDKQAAISPKSK